MAKQIPERAQVVIIGGGIVGASIAYHLTELGWNDVVLLERNTLTSGTTWHAAGLVGCLRATQNMTRLAAYSAELYESLERDIGHATGFKKVGSLSVADNPERMEELVRGAGMANAFVFLWICIRLRILWILGRNCCGLGISSIILYHLYPNHRSKKRIRRSIKRQKESCRIRNSF